MKLNYDMRINIHVLVFWDFIHQTVYLESLQIVEKQVAMELNLTQQSVFSLRRRAIQLNRSVALSKQCCGSQHETTRKKQDTAAAAILAVVDSPH